MIRSPRFRISPKVHVTSPTSWKAIAGATRAVLSESVSMQPPIPSAIATARRLGFAGRLVQSEDERIPGFQEDLGGPFDAFIQRRGLALDEAR